MNTDCPCGSDRAYDACCAPLHAGATAPDAAALMRSRYSAYVRGLDDYLLRSWHADTRPATLELDPALRWLGLEVRAYHSVDATHATVEFVARCRSGGGPATRLHEISRFVQENGHWYYVDGTFPETPTQRRRL